MWPGPTRSSCVRESSTNIIGGTVLLTTGFRLVERIFTAVELWSLAAPGCHCLQCRLAYIFAGHLDHIRSTDFPGPSRVLGHGPRPVYAAASDVLVPHMVQVDIGSTLDMVV